VSLTVRRGELLGLLGPNGAGKTTLLKAIATLLLPERGRIVIDGVDVRANPLLAKRKIGFCISEERSFYYRLSARANLEFFARLHGLRGTALRRRVEETAARVDLGDVLDRRFSQFSSGMRQRLTVARALLGDPPVLLLDEPTRAVDPVHAEALRRFVREELIERLGKTVILATNLLDEAWRLCDRIAVVKDGIIVALGPPNALHGGLRRVDRFAVTLDRADPALLAAIAAIPGVTVDALDHAADGVTVRLEISDNDEALTDLVRRVAGSGRVVRGFRTIDPSPVDVFERVTRSDV
jgi:ABC-2 type transport system ATP-binding protein